MNSSFRSLNLLLVVTLLCIVQQVASGQVFELTPQAKYESIPLKTKAVFLGDELPGEVTLRDKFPIPGNQGDVNSCAAFAAAYAVKTYQEHAQRSSWPLKLKGKDEIDPAHVFSPAFVYSLVQKHQGGKVHLPDALTVLCNEGCCPLSLLPYNEMNPTPEIGVKPLKAAQNYRCLSYHKVNHRAHTLLKMILAGKTPVIVCLNHDNAFGKLARDANGNAVWDNYSDSARIPHAAVIIGYSETREAFLLYNSFGRKWGDNGVAWISYRQFKRSVREAYVLHDIREPQGPATDETIRRRLMELIVNSLQNTTFSRRIDDTRDVKLVGRTIGKAGVEYLLDDAALRVDDVEVLQSNEGAPTRIVIKFSTSGKYKEKHFNGFGFNYEIQDDTHAASQQRLVLNKISNGFKIDEGKTETVLRGPHRSTEMLKNGATQKIVEALKEFK